MQNIAIKLRAEHLNNPDLDIRYALPDLLAKRSGGLIADNGYDYLGDANDLVLFVETNQVDIALACILEVISSVPVLDNDLRKSAIVAVERNGKYEVIFPSGYPEEFGVS
jgi:hypothetical protein